jgi:hypothetical protein
MADVQKEISKEDLITLQELFIASVAINDALSKLLIRKGLIAHDEFTEALFLERAKYDKLLNRTLQ